MTALPLSNGYRTTVLTLNSFLVTTITATWQGEDTAGDSTTIKAPGTMMAYAIAVRYRDGDFPTTTTAASTQQSTTTGATEASGQTLTSVSETASSTSTASPSSGLSTGAAAGIGVGATIGALLIFGAIGYLFWSRRRKGGRSGLPQDHGNQYPYNPELQYANQYLAVYNHEDQRTYQQYSQSPPHDASTNSYSPPPPPPELSASNDGLLYEVSAEPAPVTVKDGSRRNMR